MLKKGLIVTFTTVALAFMSVLSFAEAPTIQDPPDVIVGDLEQGAGNNVFVFEDAINLDLIVADDNTPASNIIWSYILADGKYVINGAGQLSTGDPNAPLAGELIRSIDADAVVPGQDGSAATITFRNEDLSPFAVGGGLGPYAEPGTTGILPSETRMVTLNASDGTLFDTTTITVYTSNDSSDSLSGGGPSLTPIYNLDFENNPADSAGWLGAVLGGMGTTGIATGLCMGVPLGPNPGGSVGWVSPPNFAPGPGWVPLVRKNAYRLRAELYTNQTAASAIPFFDLGYNNFQLNISDGNTYGGVFWLLDVAGGATGIGRFQTQFDFWLAPNAALTAQWNGDIDAANSAFDPSVSAKSGFNLQIRILHDNAALNTQQDGGTICLRRLNVSRVDIEALQRTILYNAPIISQAGGGDYFRDPDDFGGSVGGTFQIDNVNNVANLQLTGNPQAAGAAGLGARRKLVYLKPASAGSFNFRLFPLAWVRDRLYMVEAKIRSNVGGPSGTVEGTDPVDAVFMNFDTPTAEMGVFHFTAKGSAGNFLRAASPRLAATTAGFGGAQSYIGFIEGTEPSKAPTIDPILFEDADRIKGFVDFFNTGNLAPLGTATDGLDPLTVESVTSYQIDQSSF
jgi:hypothetical protein